MAMRSKVGLSGANFMPGKPKALLVKGHLKTQNTLQRRVIRRKSVIGVKDVETRNAKSNGNALECQMEPSKAANHCNLTNKEMKITFNEYCAFHPPTFKIEK